MSVALSELGTILPVTVVIPVTDKLSITFTELMFTTSPNVFHATVSISSPTVAPSARVTVLAFVSVKSVPEIRRTPFRYTSTNPDV